MIKHTMKTCCAALLLVSMLYMLTPAALADGGPETAPAAPTDAVTISENGTVTLTSSHMAAEKISSVQLKLNVGDENAGFSFYVGEMTKPSLKDGVLSIYIAGTTPLMGEGVTQLALGELTGVADLSGVTLVPNSLEYVYGTRTVSQAISAPQLESSTGGATLEDLNRLIGEANEKFGDGVANKDEYTPESWRDLQQALSDAIDIAQNHEATQDQLISAYNALNSAINGLVPVGRAALKKAVEEAKAKLAEGNYDLAGELEKAIAEAEAAIDANAEGTNWDAFRTEIEKIVENMTLIVNGEGGGGTVEDPNGGDTGDTTPTATAAAGKNVAPNTGDGQTLLPWAALLVLCGAILTAVIRRRVRCGR